MSKFSGPLLKPWHIFIKNVIELSMTVKMCNPRPKGYPEFLAHYDDHWARFLTIESFIRMNKTSARSLYPPSTHIIL